MTITLCRPLLKASPCTCLDLLFEGRGRCDQSRRGPEQRDLHESRTSKNYQECHPKQGQLPLLFNIHNTAARPEQESPRWCAPGKMNSAREKARGLTETSEKHFRHCDHWRVSLPTSPEPSPGLRWLCVGPAG